MNQGLWVKLVKKVKNKMRTSDHPSDLPNTPFLNIGKTQVKVIFFYDWLLKIELLIASALEEKKLRFLVKVYDFINKTGLSTNFSLNTSKLLAFCLFSVSIWA